MDTFAHRQEGWTIGVEGVAALRALDDCRHANGNAEQGNPDEKQLTHDSAGQAYSHGNNQGWNIDKDDQPKQPATAADFL